MNKKSILYFCIIWMLVAFLAGKAWAEEKLVYKGPIYNIFFHPLIAYPKLAFTPQNDHLAYMDEWFATVGEFKKIIPELYKRGFILFSPKDLFEEKKDAQGRVSLIRKKLILPEGKKPLILSLDDYNFYKTMKLHGTIHRFWIDKQGRLATITDRNNTLAFIRYDQEVPQLLEQFITQHPDFAFNNARGVIGLTGYHGVFGYDTNKPHIDNYPEQLIEAKKIAKKLKEMGWEFASHSYFHLALNQQTEPVFEASEKRWIKEVGSIVGPTDYYIFPFGDDWNEHATRFNFLKRMGYRYFFRVSRSNETLSEPGAVVMARFPMDGRSLREKYLGVRVYVNPADVIDSERLVKIR